MTNNIKIQNKPSAKKITSIIVMMLSLMLLVGANFIVFSPTYVADGSFSKSSQQQPEAPNPTEQKTKSSPDTFNIQEEYLHEKNYLTNHIWFCISKKHGVLSNVKLALVPLDPVSPPPKS